MRLVSKHEVKHEIRANFKNMSSYLQNMVFSQEYELVETLAAAAVFVVGNYFPTQTTTTATGFAS